MPRLAAALAPTLFATTSCDGRLATGALALVLAGCASAGSPPAAPARPAASNQPVAVEPIDARSATRGPAAERALEPGGATPVLLVGTTVLHIGDSMAGALGFALNDEFRRHGVKGVLRFKASSSIPYWATNPELAVVLAQKKPDLVLISLGANEVTIRNAQTRAPAIHKLIGRLKGVPCVWIAPPIFAGETKLYSVIREQAGPCRYLDTQALYPDMPRLHDHIHPTPEARNEWARRVVEWLARERRPSAAKPFSFSEATKNR